MESLDGNTLKLKTQQGKEVTVTLSADWGVRGRYKVMASDIKPGDFVGIASQPTDTGVNGALEVVVFPAFHEGDRRGRPSAGGRFEKFDDQCDRHERGEIRQRPNFDADL